MSASPLAWSVAGFDSGDFVGAGLDLRVFEDFGVAGCAALSAMTSQDAHRVLRSRTLPAERLLAQISALRTPAALKVGMLGAAANVEAVMKCAGELQAPLICDPVLAASDGTPLLDAAGVAMLGELLPHCDLLTPNCAEAGILSGMRLESLDQMPAVAKKLRARGAKAVLIKGGHLGGDEDHCWDRFEDAEGGFWLRAPRLKRHCRGTGCALSSAIAAASALGWPMRDAVVLGRAHLQRALRSGVGAKLNPAGLDFGVEDMPSAPSSREPAAMFRDWPEEPPGIYPIVDSARWVRRLGEAGVRTAQLRIKNCAAATLRREIAEASEQARRRDMRLLINDHWEEAIEQGAWGAHLGQEDAMGVDWRRLADSGLRLGLSTHSWWEIARALALNPSYIAFGPVFHTDSKAMRFPPLGLEQLRQWCRMTRGRCMRVAVGGIDAGNIKSVMDCGVDGAAMIGAVARAADWRRALDELRAAL